VKNRDYGIRISKLLYNLNDHKRLPLNCALLRWEHLPKKLQRIKISLRERQIFHYSKNMKNILQLSPQSSPKSGFSMVELIVTVGIIGVLASVAGPAYTNYQTRSRQVEAKSQLSAIYATETSYKAEHSRYSACLSAIGFAPEGNTLSGSLKDLLVFRHLHTQAIMISRQFQ
jgi:prepilin-type N-terminal cleavage/methylation domain-containing protein